MIADLLDRLEHIADEPVVPLTPDRVTRIESDLRSLYPLQQRNRRRPFTIRVAVAAAIAAVLALVVLNVSNQPVPRADLTLTSASRTVVAMPDGTRLTGRAGLVLPDGATVIVAPGGEARIGDVVIAGGSTATIDEGAIDVRRSPATRADSDERANSPRGHTPVTRAAAPPTTVESATPPPPSPVTRPPTATTTPDTRPSTTASPTTVAPRRATVTVARLRASATRRGDRVVVRWQAFPDKARVGYAVVAAPENGMPQYPPGAGSAVVARTTDDTTATISARAGIRIRVVALSDDNRVLARSGVLTPTAGA